MRQMVSFLNGALTAVALPLALCLVSVSAAQEVRPASSIGGIPKLSLDQVLNKLEEHNAKRAAELQEFDGKRIYRMQYHGFFKDRDAEMVVNVHFTAPDSKQFSIVSETGSKFVIDHVFKKLLEAEQRATTGEKRHETELCRDNYDFSLAGYEVTAGRPQYVLSLQPKGNNKYLYRGRIWVDAKDFAVVRIEGEPNRNPSMWITKTDFAHEYRKVDGFWLPAQNHTETSVRFGGKSTLSIEYQDYKVVKGPSLHITETARSRFLLPAPAND